MIPKKIKQIPYGVADFEKIHFFAAGDLRHYVFNE